jgi:hypothetical protein
MIATMNNFPTSGSVILGAWVMSALGQKRTWDCRWGVGEGIVSKRLGSPYRSGRSAHWVKLKNPKAPALTREAEEDWGR